ncbi:hypothetical protein T440DRAFT_515657 [Plenodomus tracheiphilus IPT5]|uniref:Uncharacterized protein n=1 Tax=Plenodomus tracheiphilus IPT5 TaxID=1408161 RepID=A0A6A7BDR0_9PLEO|nr:hypothetical protein T440DRAFT_515657 [Plenodomus tracheiphilus IPT5]
MLTQTSHTTTPHHPHLHTPHINPEQLSTLVTSFFSHLFAPTSYLQCTSTGRWSEALHSDANDASNSDINKHNHTIVVDDEVIIIDEERDPDGGPICREAVIERWKSGAVEVQTEQMEGKGKRRRSSSVQWVVGMVRRGSSSVGL